MHYQLIILKHMKLTVITSEWSIWISGHRRSGYRPLSSDRCIGGPSAPIR